MAMRAEQMNRDESEQRAHRAPRFVSLFNPLGRRLAGAGLMGPNALLTVRGRSTGLPRTTPVALVEIGGRRWIISVYGDVNWARNLRAAGAGTITVKGHAVDVTATELSADEGAHFFQEVLTPYVNRLLPGRLILKLLGAADVLTDPVGAAQRRPVFELKSVANGGDPARSKGRPSG